MIYLYAITAATAQVPTSLGLEDAELRLARAHEVAGLYSIHERLDPRPEPEALWRHQQVIEAAMQVGPALPVRFGTTFERGDALIASLQRRGADLRGQLDRVKGCVELAVRVGLAQPGPGERIPEDGRGYLEARLARRRRERAIVDDTLAPLRELAVGERHGDGRAETEIVRASYLVPSDEVERFSAEATLLAERNPEIWLSCTGPWPPYSFATSEAAA